MPIPLNSSNHRSIRRNVTRLVMLTITMVASTALVMAQQPKSDKPARTIDSAQVARGKYLVDNVAMCGTCHTPHNSAGVLDRRHYLEGAPLWLNPTMPITDWPLRAPRLAGQPSGSDAEVITLLTTGVWKDGNALRVPMPQFRMTREDAEAVVAYLRTITPGPQ